MNRIKRNNFAIESSRLESNIGDCAEIAGKKFNKMQLQYEQSSYVT